MKVTIKLFASLRNGRLEKETGEYPVGTTVKQVIDELDIPKDQVSIIFVNSRHAKRDQELFDGDILAFFPLVGGG